MGNIVEAMIISLLCVLVHVPSLILRIVPFREKIEDKNRHRLTFIYLIGLVLDFLLCMWKEMNGGMDVPFYKFNLIGFCIIMAVANVQLVKGYTKEHLFVFGVVANIVMITLSIGAYISSLLGMVGDGMGIAESSAIAIIVYIILYPLLRRLMKNTVTPFLETDNEDYWNAICFLPIALFFASIFADEADAYTATFTQMISKCLIGAVVLLICLAIVRGHQRILMEERLNKQIDHQKGYYYALTDQVLAEREARHNFRHQVAAIRGFLETDNIEGLRAYCDDLELEQMGMVDIPYTGNAAADGIFYYYGCLAKAKNINFSVYCRLKNLSISDNDLCVILGNALDNAVAAAGQYEGERFVEVLSEKKNDMILITVDNSFDGVVLHQNDKIYSKKRNENQEGIGIRSIKKLCEKNGGLCKFEAEGNRFQVSFLLRNDKEN